ncbi:hypothetical protein FDX14_21095 [Citrobacter sp. wls710]|nr:hypothetical protein FDX14_21095 [Citrobacter sp. wls710]
MDNCLQPVWTVAWQKRPDSLFRGDKKKLSLFFDIYQLTRRSVRAEILLAFSPYSCPRTAIATSVISRLDSTG